MRRLLKRRPLLQGPSLRTIGLLGLMLFALFTAFRILKDPVETLQVLISPDGTRTAKLEQIYYAAEPGLKISVRSGRFWRTLTYLPPLTNAPPEGFKKAIRWSSDSRRLYLAVDGEPVWTYEFPR